MSKTKGNMTETLLAKLSKQTPAADPAPVTDPPEKMTKAAKTTSVYLSADQHEKLQAIARDLETNKHAVLQLAVRRFIEEWDKGYRPEPVYKKVYR